MHPSPITISALITVILFGSLYMPQIKERFHRRINNVWVCAYYRLYEFESPDTKEVKVDPKLIVCINKLQKESKNRIVITSG